MMYAGLQRIGYGQTVTVPFKLLQHIKMNSQRQVILIFKDVPWYLVGQKAPGQTDIPAATVIYSAISFLKSSLISSPEYPKSINISSVLAPRLPFGGVARPGVRESLGAGAGWGTPSIFMMISLSILWGC